MSFKGLSFVLTALPLVIASPIANPYGPYKPPPYQPPPTQPNPPAGPVPGLPLPPIISTSTVGGADGVTVPGSLPSISLDDPSVPAALPTYGAPPPSLSSLPVPTITVGGSDGSATSLPIVGPIFSSTSTTTIIITVYPSAPVASIPLTTITSFVTVNLPNPSLSTGAADGITAPTSPIPSPSLPTSPAPPAYGPPPPPPPSPSSSPPNIIGGGGIFGPGGIFGDGGSIFGGKPNSGKNPSNGGGGFIGSPTPPSPPNGGGYGYGGSPPKQGGGDPDFTGFCDDPFFSGASSILSKFCSGSSTSGSSGTSNPPPPVPPSSPSPPPNTPSPPSPPPAGYKRATSSQAVTPEVVDAFLAACKILTSSKNPPSGLVEMCKGLQDASEKPSSPIAVAKRAAEDKCVEKQYQSITDACNKAFALIPPGTPALQTIGFGPLFCSNLAKSVPVSQLPQNGTPLSDAELQSTLASALQSLNPKIPAPLSLSNPATKRQCDPPINVKREAETSSTLVKKQYQSITDACKRSFAQVPPETPALKSIGYNAHFCLKLSASIPVSQLPANGAPLSEEEKQSVIASALRTLDSKNHPAPTSISTYPTKRDIAPPSSTSPTPGQQGLLQQILKVCEIIPVMGTEICPKLIKLIPLSSLPPDGGPLSDSEIEALIQAALGKLNGSHLPIAKRDDPSSPPTPASVLAACEKAFTDLPAGNPFVLDGKQICTEIIGFIPFYPEGKLTAGQLKTIIESVLKSYGITKRQGYHFPGSSSGSSGSGSPVPPPPSPPTPPYGSGSTGGSSGSSGSPPAPPAPPISPPHPPTIPIQPPSNPPYSPKSPSNPSPPATVAPSGSDLQAGIAAGVAAQLANSLGPNGEFNPGNFFGDDGKGSGGSGKGGYY